MFFLLAYGIYYRRNWIRVPALVYSAHVVTTLVPILATFVTAAEIASAQQRAVLISFYAPYLLIPLMLCVHMVLVEEPFAKAFKSAVKVK